MEKSIKRLKYKLANNQTIHYNEVSNILTKAIRGTNRIQDFLSYFGHIHQYILVPYEIDLKNLLGLMRFITEDTVLSCRLFAFCKIVQELVYNNDSLISRLPFIPSILETMDYHSLGPIAFVSSELGRWTSTGGQGIMINELAEGLVTLGEEIYVVSPYYLYNRRNESKYLEENIFKHTMDYEVKVGGDSYIIGLFEGVVNGVKVLFLSNEEVFKSVNNQGDGVMTLKEICVFGKACLEIFCKKKVIPSLIITNDWFTGLVAGYGRSKAFGDTFNKTKFLHVIHNLDIMYDVRIVLNYEDGV